MLLDLRSNAHVEAAGKADAGVDERTRSSLEWSISAAASIGVYTLVGGRDLALASDLAHPGRLRISDPITLANHLAAIRGSAAQQLTPLSGVVSSLARESTVTAVVGELDAASLRMLAGIRPRGSTTTALALVLDTATWAYGPGAATSPTSAPCHASARVLRAAGWQVAVVRCGDSVASAWHTLLTHRSSPTSVGLTR